MGNEQTYYPYVNPLNNRQISYNQPIRNQIITLQSLSVPVNAHAFMNNNNNNHYLNNPQPANNNISVVNTIQLQNPVINNQSLAPYQSVTSVVPIQTIAYVPPTLFINNPPLQTINNGYMHMPAARINYNQVQTIQTTAMQPAPTTAAICHNTNNVTSETRKIFQQTTNSQMTKPDQQTTKLEQLKEERKFVCEICGKQYKYLCNLKSHQKIHTDDCYKCEYCGKKFGRKSNYKEHVRVHTGECPFKCTFCNKRFKQRHGWKDHLRVHTGEKPYECNICQKRFSVGHNLNVHKRIHSGEKPFKCDLCIKTFRQKSALDFHTKSAHKQ